MLRPTIETEKILYGAPCAHLRLERAISLSAPVLFVKLPSDVLKAILLDAPLSFFGSLVPVESVAVPIIGLKVDDVSGDPFVPFQPLADLRQIDLWCNALKTSRLDVSFVNEIVIPVVEGAVSVNTSSGEELAGLFRKWSHPGGDIPEAIQERALDAFEKHLKTNNGPNSSKQLTMVSVQIKLESRQVLGLTLGTSGDFDVDCANEGANLEQTLHELIATKYPAHVLRSPEIQIDTKMRELTDLLLLSKTTAFLFESKAMAVLERGLDVSAERRAKRTMKQFQKAIDLAREVHAEVRPVA